MTDHTAGFLFADLWNQWTYLNTSHLYHFVPGPICLLQTDCWALLFTSLFINLHEIIWQRELMEFSLYYLLHSGLEWINGEYLICGEESLSLYSFMHWNVYSLCPYGNVKLCIGWFAMQCTFSRTVWRHVAEELKQWSKLQVAQRFVECINQPVPHGEILFFLGNSCIKHISKGILKNCYF